MAGTMPGCLGGDRSSRGAARELQITPTGMACSPRADPWAWQLLLSLACWADWHCLCEWQPGSAPFQYTPAVKSSFL